MEALAVVETFDEIEDGPASIKRTEKRGLLPAGSGALGPHPGQQVLRTPAAVPARTDLHHPSQGRVAPLDLGTLGGSGGRLVETDLRPDPHRSDGRWVCAG